MKNNMFFQSGSRTILNRFGLLVLAAILGSALTLGINSAFSPKTARIQYLQSNPSSLAAYNANGQTLDFTFAAEKSMPTVVHIQSTMNGKSYTTESNVPDLFRQFFGDDFSFGPRQYQSQPQVATGSGVIISADGFIVTNNHVVDQADEVEITLYDNRKFKATVVGTDPSTDLAVLQINAKDLTAIPFANSDDVKVGQWVLAVGNPFNLTSTVTAGIVSAKGRSLHILKDRAPIESFIQTDAAVNPGNSGGALVNLDGALIGINTAIASPTGTYAGYAFSIPVNIVRKIVDDLLKFGVVQRGYMGVTIRPVNADLAKEKDLDVTEGVYVDSLTENSAAKAAGIRSGDVITKIDNISVKTSSDLQELVARHSPGDAVSVTIDRNGTIKEVTVTLKNMEGTTQTVKKENVAGLSALGAEFEPITSKEQKKYDLKGGVKVKKLVAGKIRKFTDMREGFIITKVDGQPVTNVEDLTRVIASKKGGILIEGIYPEYPGIYYYALGL